jgi:Tol biopolymer transport system component
VSARRTPSNRRLPSSRGDGTLIALSSSEDLIGDNPDGSDEILVHDTTDGTTTQPTAGPGVDVAPAS